MAKKNQEQLEKLQDAATRFKKIKAQDPGDNEIFSEELDSITLKLLNKMHEVVSQKFSKPSKRPQTKTEMPEHRGTSTTIKVNEKEVELGSPIKGRVKKKATTGVAPTCLFLKCIFSTAKRAFKGRKAALFLSSRLSCRCSTVV
jgi:hypothetical protein